MYVKNESYYEGLLLIVVSIFMSDVINSFVYFHKISSNLAVSNNNKTSLDCLLVKIPEEIFIKKEQELEWFCGFSEAESMFYISNTGALSFRIKLHWDDRGVLEYIKNLLSELARIPSGD